MDEHVRFIGGEPKGPEEIEIAQAVASVTNAMVRATMDFSDPIPWMVLPSYIATMLGQLEDPVGSWASLRKHMDEMIPKVVEARKRTAN